MLKSVELSFKWKIRVEIVTVLGKLGVLVFSLNRSVISQSWIIIIKNQPKWKKERKKKTFQDKTIVSGARRPFCAISLLYNFEKMPSRQLFDFMEITRSQLSWHGAFKSVPFSRSWRWSQREEQLVWHLVLVTVLSRAGGCEALIS